MNFIVTTVIIISLCGDVETNPGPGSQDDGQDSRHTDQGPSGSHHQMNPNRTVSYPNSYQPPGSTPMSQDYPGYFNAMNYSQGQAQGQYAYVDQGNSLYQLLDSRLSKIDDKLERVYQHQLGTDSALADIQRTLRSINERQTEIENEMEDTRRDVEEIRHEQSRVIHRLENMERKSIENNIRVFNIPDVNEIKTEAELKQKFVTFVDEKLGVQITARDISNIYHSGRTRGKHVFVELALRETKRSIMSNLKKLKETDPRNEISFCDDLTPLELTNRKSNLPLFKQLRASAGERDRVELRRGELIVNRIRRTPDEARDLLRKVHGPSNDRQHRTLAMDTTTVPGRPRAVPIRGATAATATVASEAPGRPLTQPTVGETAAQTLTFGTNFPNA